jgi:hypothetical protein
MKSWAQTKIDGERLRMKLTVLEAERLNKHTRFTINDCDNDIVSCLYSWDVSDYQRIVVSVDRCAWLRKKELVPAILYTGGKLDLGRTKPAKILARLLRKIKERTAQPIRL